MFIRSNGNCESTKSHTVLKKKTANAMESLDFKKKQSAGPIVENKSLIKYH